MAIAEQTGSHEPVVLLVGDLIRFSALLSRLLRPTVLFDPLTAELNGLVRGQPGPIGATGPQRNPDSFAVDMLFNRERSRLRHNFALTTRDKMDATSA